MEEDIEKKDKIEDNEKGADLKPEELKKELENCQKLANEYLTGWQRSRADFLNYKKEEMERIREFLKYANEELILKILPILDNFEKAEKEIPDNKKNDKFLEGVLQIKTQLQDFLKNQGVKRIKTIGEKFDPNFHEAVEGIEVKPSSTEAPAFDKSSADLSKGKDKEPGIIIEEVQKGYLLHGKVLRPARVKISK